MYLLDTHLDNERPLNFVYTAQSSYRRLVSDSIHSTSNGTNALIDKIQLFEAVH